MSNVKNSIEGQETDEDEDEGTPVCIKCLRPVDSPSQHYCPTCGNVTGAYTPYIPFLNIPFNCSIYATLWSRIKSDQTKGHVKLLNVLFVLLTSPLMIIIGISLLLFWKLLLKKR